MTVHDPMIAPESRQREPEAAGERTTLTIGRVLRMLVTILLFTIGIAQLLCGLAFVAFFITCAMS